MQRYQARQTAGVWFIFDRLTCESLAAPLAEGADTAGALSDLLNALDDQQDWRRQADAALGGRA